MSIGKYYNCGEMDTNYKKKVLKILNKKKCILQLSSRSVTFVY